MEEIVNINGVEYQVVTTSTDGWECTRCDCQEICRDYSNTHEGNHPCNLADGGNIGKILKKKDIVEELKKQNPLSHDALVAKIERADESIKLIDDTLELLNDINVDIDNVLLMIDLEGIVHNLCVMHPDSARALITPLITEYENTRTMFENLKANSDKLLKTFNHQ